MNPMMLVGLLPDSQRVSREAAARHALLTARRDRTPAVTTRRRALTLALQQ